MALLLVVAPAVVWQYGVGGTVSRLRDTAKLRRQITELRSTQAPGENRYEIPEQDVEMISSGLVVAKLLPLIEAEKLRIENFSPCITSEADGVRLTTGQLSVQGAFTGIVKLLAGLESDVPGCKIISAHYRTTTPRNRGAAKTLSCTIYIQQITIEKSIK